MRYFQLAICALLILVAASPSAAQTTYATITGTVTDPSGLAVPGATVEATHVQSNYRYTAISNEAGVYTLAQLRDGDYTVRVRAGGFRESVVQSVPLVAMEVRRLDFALQLGSVETAVEVSGAA